jgi:hypothetical protein
VQQAQLKLEWHTAATLGKSLKKERKLDQSYKANKILLSQMKMMQGIS